MSLRDKKIIAITAMGQAIKRLQQLSGPYAGNEDEITALRDAIKTLTN
ncbi:MAG: hypothetical protein ACLQF0_01425 [Dissulfurispiraceae bacterium]